MKKTKLLPLFLSLFVGVVLLSCATKPIEQQYPERWEKTIIGMSVEEFKQIWPEAKYGGSGDMQNSPNTETWTFTLSRPLSSPVRVAFFSFQDGELLKFFER
jgi:hypothetical protein